MPEFWFRRNNDGPFIWRPLCEPAASAPIFRHPPSHQTTCIGIDGKREIVRCCRSHFLYTLTLAWCVGIEQSGGEVSNKPTLSSCVAHQIYEAIFVTWRIWCSRVQNGKPFINHQQRVAIGQFFVIARQIGPELAHHLLPVYDRWIGSWGTEALFTKYRDRHR